MKYILLSAFVLLTGCAQIKAMLVQHDPALANLYVETVVKVQDAECSDKSTINNAIQSARKLAKYAEFRDDPQVESATAVLTNLNKAAASDAAACQRWINLSGQRLQILNKAWSSR